MAKLTVRLYLSYSQLCVFVGSLSQPYNDWSDRSYSQGFSWRPGSVSFRTLIDEGEHEIAVFLEENIPEIQSNVIRAFRVPLHVTGNLELASISESIPLELSIGVYSLQIEFFEPTSEEVTRANIRINRGETDFLILRADEGIEVDGDFDLDALPAS